MQSHGNAVSWHKKHRSEGVDESFGGGSIPAAADLRCAIENHRSLTSMVSDEMPYFMRKRRRAYDR